jgi:hypothetical protein
LSSLDAGIVSKADKLKQKNRCVFCCNLAIILGSSLAIELEGVELHRSIGVAVLLRRRKKQLPRRLGLSAFLMDDFLQWEMRPAQVHAVLRMASLRLALRSALLLEY